MRLPRRVFSKEAFQRLTATIVLACACAAVLLATQNQASSRTTLFVIVGYVAASVCAVFSVLALVGWIQFIVGTRTVAAEQNVFLTKRTQKAVGHVASFCQLFVQRLTVLTQLLSMVFYLSCSLLFLYLMLFATTKLLFAWRGSPHLQLED